MLDYKIMYVSRTGNTQRLAVCIYQSLQQLGNGDIEEINCNTEPGKSHLFGMWDFCVGKKRRLPHRSAGTSEKST